MVTEQKPRRHKLFSLLRITLGWIFLVAGLLGLFLPILQGILFTAIGALLLSPDIKFFRKLLDRLENRFPWLKTRLRKWREYLD